MSEGENAISNEFAQEEVKTIVHYIEQHIHWAKLDDNDGLARLHTHDHRRISNRVCQLGSDSVRKFERE